MAESAAGRRRGALLDPLLRDRVSGLGYHWWEIGVKRGNVLRISTLAYFIPIGSTLLIGLLFREAMGSGLLFGAVLIADGRLASGTDAEGKRITSAKCLVIVRDFVLTVFNGKMPSGVMIDYCPEIK